MGFTASKITLKDQDANENTKQPSLMTDLKLCYLELVKEGCKYKACMGNRNQTITKTSNQTKPNCSVGTSSLSHSSFSLQTQPPRVSKQRKGTKMPILGGYCDSSLEVAYT